MNTFSAVMCLALVASATAIAVNSGYNYQAPKQFRPSPPVYSPPQQQYQPSFVPSGPGPQYNAPIGLPAPPQYAAPTTEYLPPAPQYVAPVQQPQEIYSGPGPVAPQYQPSVNNNYQPQQQTIVSKDIFIHAAPEETEEIGADQGAVAGPNRKNYRIVFIKAPAQNLKLNLASLKRAQASNEEKTVIYVLSKKPDLGNLQSQLSAVQTEQKAHKPEVFFIKYKTQEEANRAQQEIQAQYDSLGGSTSITDEGIAPVTSVIGGGPVNVGSVGGSSYNGGNGGSFSSGSGDSSYNGGNGGSFSSGSGGSSYNGGSFSSGGSSYAGPVQQQFVQQSYQSSQGSAVSFSGSGPSQKYLPAQKK